MQSTQRTMNGLRRVWLKRSLAIVLLVLISLLYFGNLDHQNIHLIPTPRDVEHHARESLQGQEEVLSEALPAWTEGMLDFHHIFTGGGESTFIIFPDGTTMVRDLGALDYDTWKERDYLNLVPPIGSLTHAQIALAYIKQVYPRTEEQHKPVIDYALVSHFHTDHYGDVHGATKLSPNGEYKLTGMIEFEDLMPIQRLIDRAYPNYIVGKDDSLRNYVKFVHSNGSRGNLKIEKAIPGSKTQIKLLKNNAYDFHTRIVKVNADIWEGTDEETSKTFFTLDDMPANSKKKSENALGIGIKFKYGAFDYFSGADIFGMPKVAGLSDMFDLASPVANVVGAVDVATALHHGQRDGMNDKYISTLKPRVFIQQSWTSDQPGQETYYKMISKDLYSGPRDIFATYIFPETKKTYGRWFVEGYKSMAGHIVVRVMPGGSEYYVYILDHTKLQLKVIDKFGPYKSQ